MSWNSSTDGFPLTEGILYVIYDKKYGHQLAYYAHCSFWHRSWAAIHKKALRYTQVLYWMQLGDFPHAVD